MKIINYFCLSFLLLFLSSCSQKKKDSGECQKDTDCKGERICENKKCVFLKVSDNNTHKISPKNPNKPPKNRSNKKNPFNFKIPKLPKKPTLPNLPNFPKIPKMSKNFKMPSLFKSLNLDLKFNVKVGNKNYKYKLKGFKRGMPQVEECVNNICKNIDLSDPKAIEKMLGLFLQSRKKNDPVLKSFLEMFKGLSKLKKFPSNPKFPGFPSIPRTPFNFAPPANKNLNTYKGWDAIQKVGRKALGAEGILYNLTPIQISSETVTFKTKDGKKVIAVVPELLKTTIPALARTKKPVIIRIKLITITKRVIKGELKETEIKK
jgi:hypothetical protein